MRSNFFTVMVAAFASVAAAYTTPVGSAPQGNPIHLPGLNDIVPAGKTYTITWTPTSAPNTVSLVLLRGPGENVKPLYAIAEKIPNTGSYTWTVSGDLQADTTHYGLQLIDDVTGFYQYSTQFGVSNSVVVVSSSSAPVVPEETSSVPPKDSPATTTGGSYETGAPVVTFSTHYETVTSCDCETATVAPVPVGTGSPSYPSAPASGWNSTVVYTTPSSSVVYTNPSASVVPESSSHPSYNVSTSTTPEAPLYTGAASSIKVGGALVAVVAGMVFALF